MVTGVRGKLIAARRGFATAACAEMESRPGRIRPGRLSISAQAAVAKPRRAAISFPLTPVTMPRALAAPHAAMAPPAGWRAGTPRDPVSP